MSDSESLARQVEAAQSILQTPAALEARRVERAVATTNRAVAAAMNTLSPEVGAGVRVSPSAVAIFAGAGSPITQALSVGLEAPLDAAELDAIERHLRPTGQGAAQLELTPFADPAVAALLATRQYRVNEWQLVWTRPIVQETLAPPAPELTIRRVESGQEELFLHAVMAGFLESEEVPAEVLALIRPVLFAAQHEHYLAWLGDEAIGGASLAWADGIALINGSGVRPGFRRRGAQGALIRARLQRAQELGCELASSTTLPGTASRRNMERHGFHVAYPKLVMLHEA